ncbi:hypothetical protein [Paraburkholderia bryophila]|uniref:Uncharacterized protein n=1 Tax=Paraburkholderia bryophila TaxID=420952 RepID=A0A329BGU7_9BURK|nr:hypothetical protein [Paraburkholderia bryophila]RAS21509.1 hypothetical protein BX591_12828 [Paraburkholderia bryophila]
MTQRLSDVVLAALTQQIAGEIEHVLVNRIQAIGIGPQPAVLNADAMNDIRRIVRRILGDAAAADVQGR